MRDVDARTVRLGVAGLVVIALVIFGATKLLGDDDDGGDGSASEPVGLSESELIDKADEFDHPAYWLGPLPGVDEYELTDVPDERVYIRYLGSDADPGDPRANFVTVGTYEIPDAMDALRQAEDAGGTKGIRKGDGFSFLEATNELSTYVVFDDQPDLQIEIFDPNPGNSLDFATSAALRPLG